MTKHHIALPVLTILCFSPIAIAANEPADLDDKITTPTYGYEVYYTNDATNLADFISDADANDVADSLDPFVDRIVGLGFKTPNFTVTPEEIHIFDSGNVGQAWNSHITLDSPNLSGQTEPALRLVTDHEHFHQTQFAYIKFNQWASWGAWNVEGTARLMQDKLWNDLDGNLGILTFWQEISTYMTKTTTRLQNLSYSSCLFWQYLCEQLGTVQTEPEYGTDVILRFWQETDGKAPDGMGALRRTINAFSTSRGLDEMFQDFAITNYTKDRIVNKIQHPERYQYVDDDTQAYSAVPLHLNQAFPPTIGPTAANVAEYAARYYLGRPNETTLGNVVGFKSTGDRAAYGVMAVRDNEVVSLQKGIGTEFARCFFNPRSDSLDSVVAVVAGLDAAANYSYTFAAGALKLSIIEPTYNRLAWVGPPDDPKTFIAKLQVSGPNDLGGDTVWGLRAEDFTAKVGDQDAPVLSGSYVQGEFWLLIQAPMQTAGGPQYTFAITLGDIETSQGNAVLYATMKQNEIIVIDGSGSMLDPVDFPKIDAAKAAALMYVDSAASADNMAVVSFGGDGNEPNEDAVTQIALKPVGPNRNSMRTAVKGVSIADPSVMTSIGDGLNNAQDQLDTMANPENMPFIVLLSDGMENEARYWSSDATLRNRIKDAGTHVISIALGPSADQALMQDIADETDGYYYYVDLNPDNPSGKTGTPKESRATLQAVENYPDLSYAVRLADVYKLSNEFVNQQGRLWEDSGNRQAGEIYEGAFSLEEDINHAVFSVFWSNQEAEMGVDLIRPNGSVVQNGDPGVTIFTSKNHIVYHIVELQHGKWGVAMQPHADTDFIATLSGQPASGLQMRIRFVANQVTSLIREYDRDGKILFLRGLPMPIQATLVDKYGPVTNASVVAQVLAPDGRVDIVPLFDDGNHEDQEAGDGIYGGVFRRTTMASQYGTSDGVKAAGEKGSYLVQVTARGQDNKEIEFNRIGKAGFQVFEFWDGKMTNPDPDGDGMPNRWETLYGLDTIKDDTTADPDKDGLINRDEYLHGTIPIDPDSDHGGESDYSELVNARNNYDARDDDLPRPIDCGVIQGVIDLPVNIPVPKTNLVYFPMSPQYVGFLLYRGTVANSLALYKEINAQDIADGIYADDNVTNGITYYYQVVAVGQSGVRSAPSRVFTGTPKADPVPPKGWIKINNGTGRTDSLDVRLDLDAYADISNMSISNAADFSDAAWQASSSTVPHWMAVANPLGPFAVVYAKFRDAAGNESIVYADQVWLDFDGDPDGDKFPNQDDPDNDGDGLDDPFELYQSRTNHFEPDSDDNKISDDQEDFDKDDLINIQEQTWQTNPWNPDTDNDKYPDGFEISRGSDPTNPRSVPAGPVPTHTPTITPVVRPTRTPQPTTAPTRTIGPTLPPTQGPTAPPTQQPTVPPTQMPTPTPMEELPTPTPVPAGFNLLLLGDVFELAIQNFTQQTVILFDASSVTRIGQDTTPQKYRFGYSSLGMNANALVSLPDGSLLTVAQTDPDYRTVIVNVTAKGDIVPFAEISLPDVLVDQEVWQLSSLTITGMSYNGIDTLDLLLSANGMDASGTQWFQATLMTKIIGPFSTQGIRDFGKR